MVPQFHPFVETCPSTMDLSSLLSQLHEPCWWCRASLSPCQPSPWSAMTWWMFCPIVYRNNFTFDLRKVRFFFSSSCNQVWYNHINSDKVVIPCRRPVIVSSSLFSSADGDKFKNWRTHRNVLGEGWDVGLAAQMLLQGGMQRAWDTFRAGRKSRR